MPWEYLTSELFDRPRFDGLAAALQPFCAGADVLDLNCGPARLARLLSGWKSYYGNDTYPPFVALAQGYGLAGATFEAKPDAAVDRPCDVLIYAGVGCAEYKPEPLESSTGTESFFRLVANRQPRVVAIEMVERWQEMYRAADEYSRRLEAAGYRLAEMGSCDLPGEEFWHRRLWMVFHR